MSSFAHSCVYPSLRHPPWLAHLLPHLGWRHGGAFAHGKDTSVPEEQTVNSSRGGQEKGRFGVLLNEQFGEMRRKWLLEYFSATWHLLSQECLQEAWSDFQLSAAVTIIPTFVGILTTLAWCVCARYRRDLGWVCCLFGVFFQKLHATAF